MDGPSFASTEEVKAIWLERDFEEEKVKRVVKAMNGEKVPGLDDFSMVFFQDCLVVLKEDIMKVFRDFHARGNFEKGLNAMLIGLILKTPSVVDLNDFHPISLMVGIYKIIAKILAIRLKMVLEKIISKR